MDADGLKSLSPRDVCKDNDDLIRQAYIIIYT